MQKPLPYLSTDMNVINVMLHDAAEKTQNRYTIHRSSLHLVENSNTGLKGTENKIGLY